jgi:hypothetical protein
MLQDLMSESKIFQSAPFGLDFNQTILIYNFASIPLSALAFLCPYNILF